MTILRGYLFRTIVGTTALVLAVLLSLGSFIEFVTQLDDIGVGDYTLPRALVWVLMMMPKTIFETLPIAVLLGALLGLGSLASKSELIVLRTSGVSPRSIAVAVLATGIVLGIVAGLLGEVIAPPLERFARQYRALAKFGEIGVSAESTWVREGNLILNVSPPTDSRPEGGAWLFRLDSAGTLAAVGRADSVEIEDGNQWVLQNYAESVFTPEGVSATLRSRSPALAGVNPDLLSLTVIREDTLTGAALWRYVQYLRRNGLDARRYEVAFWNRIAKSCAVPLMCILAVPFVLGPLRSGGAGGRMLLGLGIGLLWFLVSRTLVDGGAIWNLSPPVVAWTPTILLGVATTWLLGRAR